MGIFGLADVVTGGLSALGGMFTNQANAKQAHLNRRFQERMANTQVQRSVADYQAAGLNPYLAYESKNASPGGASAQLGNPLGEGVSSALQAQQARAQVELVKQQAEKAKWDAKSSEMDARLKSGDGIGIPGGQPNWLAVQMARLNNEFQGYRFLEDKRWPAELRQLLASADASEANAFLSRVNARLAGADVNKRTFYSDLWGMANDVSALVRREAPGKLRFGAESMAAAGAVSARQAQALLDYLRSVTRGDRLPQYRDR